MRRVTSKELVGVSGCLLFVAVALGTSQRVQAQRVTDTAAVSEPCTGVTEPSIMSILPDSAHAKASGGDLEYKATLEALVRARTAVMNKEAEANFYAAKSRAEMDRDRAMRDSGSFSNWTSARLELEKVCLEIDSYRLQRLSSAQFRKAEVARLQAVTKSLQEDAALTPEAFRQKELARIAQEAKSPAQSMANIKARIAVATQERDALAKSVFK